jgi:lysophospholipase L1-like esterase
VNIVSRNSSSKHCFQYTALGDSIAFGVGATNNFGYVKYLRDFLETQFSCVNLKNRAVPGFTSSDLLRQLKNDNATREAVKHASLITISIGGNNLNCDVNVTCLSNGVATFTRDWTRILKEIRNSIGSRAELFIMTVYNPFRGDDPNFQFADFYIQKINKIIKKRKFLSKYDYNVVDVHADFLGQFSDGQWKVCTWTHFCETPPNVHPTDTGHLEIERLHELKFLKHHF